MSSIHNTDPAEFGYQQWFNKPSSSIVRPNIFDSSDLIKIVLLPLPPLVCITTVAPRKYKIFADNPHYWWGFRAGETGKWEVWDIVLLITMQFHNFPNYLSCWLQARADRIIRQLINSFSLHLAPPTGSVQTISLCTKRRSLELGARRMFENVPDMCCDLCFDGKTQDVTFHDIRHPTTWEWTMTGNWKMNLLTLSGSTSMIIQ